MSRLGISYCWSILRNPETSSLRDDPLVPEMFKGTSKDAFEFIVEHYRTHGVLPHEMTVLDEIDIEDEFVFDTPEPPAYYANRVIERDALNAQREQVKSIGEALRTRDPQAVHEAAKSVVQVGLDKLNTGNGILVNLKLNGPERWERYQELKNTEGGLRGIRSAWPRIDDETGGFKPGDLVTIVARLGLGKTFNALLNAVVAGQNNYSVGFVSPEMSRTSLELRRDAILYKLPYRDLLRGELDFETEEYYRGQLQAVPPDTDPDWFVAAEGRVRDVADAEMFVRDTRVDMLVVDGIYLLNGGSDRLPKHERVALVVEGLKSLAVRCRIPILATAQFNRSVRTGATRAGAESIGHTDAIGQYSDIVIGMFQDEPMRASQQMTIRLLKNREGQPVDLTINWNMVSMDFSSIDQGGEINGHDEDGQDAGIQNIIF